MDVGKYISDVKKGLKMKSPRLDEAIPEEDLLSSGSTILNLAATGRVEGCFVKGRYCYLVGDTQSGKTWLTHTCLAEACLNPNFDDYRFIVDDVEGGILMDIPYYFGQKVADRIEAPRYEDGDPVFSETIEDFYDNIDDNLDHEKPCIYILDSMDALFSEAQADKFETNKNLRRSGKETKGEMSDGKAKANSSGIRRILSKLRKTKSILIVINQTRDNVGAGPFAPTKTRSGGRALSFYASLELWSSVGQTIKKTVNGVERKIGAISKVKVEKNRFTGKNYIINIPFYNSVGIDDVGGMINYLIQEKHWTKEGQKVKCPELDFEGKLETLIKKIQDEDKEELVRDICQIVWDRIEESCKVARKRRYE